MGKKKKTAPSLVVDYADSDEDCFLVLAEARLVLTATAFSLGTVDLEAVTEAEWEDFLDKARAAAAELGIPFENKVTDVTF